MTLSLIPDKNQHNYLQRCYFLINLLKEKDYDLWENFHAQYCVTGPEESWELFQMVLEEYQKLLPKKSQRKTSSKRSQKKAA